jgi:hypothetical protein
MASANAVLEWPRQGLHHAFGEQVGERLDVVGPARGVGMIPGAQLGVELEQPGVAVGLLEAAVLVEELQLALHCLARQVIAQLLLHQPADRQLGKLLVEAHHRPGRVDRRVPVPAAVKGAVALVVRAACGDELVEVGAAIARRGVRPIEAR